MLSLNAFETTKEMNKVHLQAASNGYYNAAYQGSTKVGSDLYLNFAVSGNGQPDQDFEYQYSSGASVLTSERDYSYDSYTTTLKLFSDPDKDFSYKLGFYTDNYEHDKFYHNGTDVEAQDFGYLDNDMQMIKAEAKWNLGNKRSLTFDVHGWNTYHTFSRILPNLNRIYIYADEEQSGTNLVYKDETLLPDTQLSLVLGYRKNQMGAASREVYTPAGAQVVQAPLLFANAKREIRSALIDGKTSFANGEYILRYGLRLDNYSDFGDQSTPRIGLIKKLSDNSVVKFLYGNAFRAPSGNELYGGPQQTGDLNLTPEEIDTYELVYLFENDKRKTEIVIFHSDLKNSIQQVDNIPIDFFANVGAENTSEGIEVSHSQSFEQWQLDVSASYVNSKNDTDGYDYGAFPKYIINLGVGYRFKNNWLLFVNNRVHLDADREPSTATFDAAALRDYWRTDLHLSKKYGGEWEIFANIRNLFDRQNELPSLQNSGVNTFQTGIQDEEISLDAGFRYKF